MPEPEKSVKIPGPEKGVALHKRLYFTSAAHTLLFYGTVVVVCLVFHVLVALAVSVFFLLFYKKEIRAFLARPLRGLRRPRGEPKPPYRLEALPPGSLRRPAGDGKRKSG